MNRPCVRLASLALIAAFLFTLAPFSVVADSESSPLAVSLDIFNKDLWISSDGVFDISVTDTDERRSVSVSAERNTRSMTFGVRIPETDLSLYNELAITFALIGDDTGHTVSVFAKGTSGSHKEEIKLTSGEKTLYLPLETGTLTDISFTVSASESEGSLGYFTLTDISADNGYTYYYSRLFGATDLYSENKHEKDRSGISVTPESSSLSLYADFESNFSSKEDVLTYFTIGGGLTSGSIRACITYGDGTFYETNVSTVAGDGTYSFITKGGFDSYSLLLFDLPSAVTSVKFTSGGIFSLGESKKSIGAISSCRYDGKELTVSGSLSNDASVQYYGSKIFLYAIPASAVPSYDLSELSPIAQTGFSTKFRISADLDRTYAEYFYLTVLDTKEGLLPIGGLTAPAGGQVSATATNAVSAIHGADAADLFETNASSVILDIDGGRLSVPEGTHAAEVYSYGKNYYFDSDYLRQLDDRINFLAAAGINSYLRIYSDLEGHTFDYSPDRKESLSLMCAIAGFLAERYPSVKGYIIGSAANTNVSSLTAEYAESRARLFSVFCESVRSRNPYAQVIIPYSEVGTCDPHLTAAMTDYYLSKYSAGTQSFMLETAKGATSAIASASRLSDTATSVGFSSGGASMIWIAPGEYGADRITEAYRELCMQSAAHGFIFCAVSVEKTDKSPILYEALKQMLDRENVISASSSQFTASDSANGFSGVYSLWDFTSSYDTKGWVSGGSFAPPITAKGENGERVLRADNSDISKSAGILICRTEAPLDMTGVSARFTLSVESDTANFAEIALILGSGESRAEFSATVECNKKTSLTCDLQDFEGARSIDYAAIIVRGGEGASATVSHVELCSKELTDEEMSLRFSSERPSPHNPLLYAVIIFTAAGTVTVFSVLIKKQTSHKKKEENNEK